MLGRRLFSTSLYGEVSKPKKSILVSTVKFVVSFALVGSSLLTYSAYSSIHYNLETLKYVDIRKVKSFIPKERNVIDNRNLTSQSLDSLKDQARVIFAIRKQVEPTIPAETKKRFSEEASVERDVLLNAFFFGVDKEGGARVTAQLLPYYFNEDEIEKINIALKKAFS